jgi:hypothetical protein
MIGTWRDMKLRLRAAIESADQRRLLMAVQAKGRSILRALVAAKGPLDPALARQARDYAGDVLGHPRHALWLQVYAATQDRFTEGWLPDSYFFEFVRPRVNGSYHHMSRYRAANGLFFPHGTLPDVARLANGLVLAPSGQPIDAAQIAATARAHGYSLIFKSDASAYGHGLRFITPEQLTETLLADLGNGVLQRRLLSHPVFARFGTEALATLRIVTTVDACGQPSARAGYLKLGRSKDSHVLADDNLRIPMDLATGAVSETGFDTSLRALRAHPDTAAPFAGLIVPKAAEVLASAVKLHRLVPFPRYVSWDFAIDAAEDVHLLEWEGGSPAFAEATQGPCFLGLGWDRLHLG